MNRVMKLARTSLLVAGIGGVTAAAEPAAAQITCPQGYFYSSTRGCLPVGEGPILANEHLLRPDDVSPTPMLRPLPAPAHVGGGLVGDSFGGSFGHSFGGGFGRR